MSNPHPDTAPESLPAVLYVAHRVPYPPDKGDRIRNFHVLRELTRHARVWLATLADEQITPETEANLKAMCEEVCIVPVHGRLRWLRAGTSLLRGRSLSEGAFFEPALAKQIDHWVKTIPFQTVLVSSSALAPYITRRGHENLNRFVDLVDVDSQKWHDFAASTPGLKRHLYKLEGNRVRKLEREITNWSHGITLVSAAEARLFDGFTRPGAATVATNGVNLDQFQPQPEAPEQNALSFVGALDYWPNIDAACWFSQEIWPEIYRRHPDWQFWIIGRKPTAAVLALAAIPGVKVVGQVPDVRPHVAAAAIAVAPIRVARGLQNKVLEAMAMARPTLAAPAAIAALKAAVGEDLLSPTTPTEWVEQVCKLIDDPAERHRLALAGREFVERHHHWDRSLQPLMELMQLQAQTAGMCEGKVPQ